MRNYDPVLFEPEFSYTNPKTANETAFEHTFLSLLSMSTTHSVRRSSSSRGIAPMVMSALITGQGLISFLSSSPCEKDVTANEDAYDSSAFPKYLRVT